MPVPVRALGLDRHRFDVARAHGFEQGSAIGGIGLVAANIGLDVLRGQQGDAVAHGSQPAAEVVRRAAGLHDHMDDRVIEPESDEFGALEAQLAHGPERGIGAGKPEHLLGQIDGDGCNMCGSSSRVHGGLHLHESPLAGVDVALNIDTSKLGTSMPYRPRDESIPSLNWTCGDMLRSNRPLRVAGQLARR